MDIFLDILLKPPQPLMGLFFPPPPLLKNLRAARIDELADSNEPATISRSERNPHGSSYVLLKNYGFQSFQT